MLPPSGAGSSGDGEDAGGAGGGGSGGRGGRGGSSGGGGARQLREEQQLQQRKATVTGKAAAGQRHLTFMGYDPAVLALMPQWVQVQVPFLATARAAVDRQTNQLITTLVGSGVSFNSISAQLKELAHVQHFTRMLAYFGFAACAKEMEAKQRGAGVRANPPSAAPHQSCALAGGSPCFACCCRSAHTGSPRTQLTRLHPYPTAHPTQGKASQPSWLLSAGATLPSRRILAVPRRWGCLRRQSST